MIGELRTDTLVGFGNWEFGFGICSCRCPSGNVGHLRTDTPCQISDLGVRIWGFDHFSLANLHVGVRPEMLDTCGRTDTL
jgi:hypothetical protein